MEDAGYDDVFIGPSAIKKQEDPLASDVWVSLGSMNMDKVNEEEEDEDLATEKEKVKWLEIEKMEEEVIKIGDVFEEPQIEESDHIKPNFTLGDVKEVSEGEKSHISNAEYIMDSNEDLESSQKVSEVA